MRLPVVPKIGYEEYMPIRAYEGDIGFDIFNAASVEIVLPPKELLLLPSGLYHVPYERPPFNWLLRLFGAELHWDLQIRSRSSLARKGIIVANEPATIDSDYDGEIKVILANISSKTYVVKPKERIAQLVLSLAVVPSGYRTMITKTCRRDLGFGSSNMKGVVSDYAA